MATGKTLKEQVSRKEGIRSKMFCGALKKRKPLDELGDSVYYCEPNTQLCPTSAKKKIKSSIVNDENTPSPQHRPVKRHSKVLTNFDRPEKRNEITQEKQSAQMPKSIRMQGQLRLGAYVNNGLLTIHVIQAKNLPTNSDKQGISLVDVSLIPDDNLKTLCTTESCFGTTNPVYDQKVSYEILEEDSRKRLFLSVWNKTGEKKREFLGSMSFGVKHLMQKNNSDGWFHLLSEDVGKRKHLQMAKDSSLTEEKQADTQTLLIRLTKTPLGFGFSVKGNNPVRVGRVEPGSAGEKGGLREGDGIIKVNSQNVSRSGSIVVGKILREADDIVKLEIQRKISSHPKAPSSLASSKSTLFDQCSSYQGSELSLWKFSKFSRSGLICNERPDCDSDTYVSFDGDLNDTAPLNSKMSMWDDSADKAMLDSRPPLDSLLYYSVNNMNPHPWDTTWQPQGLVTKSWHSEHALLQIEEECDKIVSDVEESILGYQSVSGYQSALEISEVEKVNASIDLNSTTQSVMQSNRYQAIEALCKLEELFIQIMQFGIHRYSRPLRHCVLSQEQHAAMFQNIEKLSLISEFHVRTTHEQILHETRSSSSSGESTESIGNIYKPKIQMMCEAYELYCKGLPQALALLDEIKHYQEFQKFLVLNTAEMGQPTLNSILEWPQKHMKQLHKTLQVIYSQTLPSHPDFYNLRDVVAAMDTCCNSIARSTSVAKQPTQKTSKTSVTSSTSSSSKPRSHTGSVRSFTSAATSTSSIDSEVMEVQSKLNWPKDIQKIQLASPNRHIIYSGDLQWVDGWKWVKAHVFLFSDLLLLTVPGEGDSYTVVENPIFLWDITGCDFSCFHPSEFSLSVATGNQVNQMTFRGECIEQKCTWKNILEHRIRSCQNNKDLLTFRGCEAISL